MSTLNTTHLSNSHAYKRVCTRDGPPVLDIEYKELWPWPWKGLALASKTTGHGLDTETVNFSFPCFDCHN